MSFTSRPHAFLAWAVDMFGPIARNRDERAARFLEEAAELAHAAGLPRDTAGKILDRVYERPAGELRREVGQAQATLELFAQNEGMSVDVEAEREWERVNKIPREEWQRRHGAKIAGGIANLTT